MKRLKLNYKFRDTRGIFIEVWKGRRWRQMNYFSCRKSCTRGGHYHKKTNELFFVIKGLCEVTVINVKTHRQQVFLAREKEVFLIEPFEAHYIKALRDAQVITLLDSFHNAAKPDIHLYER